METIRALAEGFLRGRYGFEGPMAASRALATVVLIGAIVVVGWLLPPWLTIPRFTAEGPVVRNGVAVVVACGNKRAGGMKYVPEPGTGTWWDVHRGDCTVWYHQPPGAEQRFNRHQRAANLPVSREVLQTEGVRRSESQIEKLPVVEKLPRAKR